jgi:hypothetical protein
MHWLTPDVEEDKEKGEVDNNNSAEVLPRWLTAGCPISHEETFCLCSWFVGCLVMFELQRLFSVER